MGAKNPLVVDVKVTDVSESQGARIAVFMNVHYALGVPTYTERPGEKERIGYEAVYRPYHLRERKVPLRPVFKIQGDDYKMLIRRNDNFQSCIENLASLLVRSRGRKHFFDKRSAKDEEPVLRLTYDNQELEKRLLII
jgi:hypothetical protein